MQGSAFPTRHQLNDLPWRAHFAWSSHWHPAEVRPIGLPRAILRSSCMYIFQTASSSAAFSPSIGSSISSTCLTSSGSTKWTSESRMTGGTSLLCLMAISERSLYRSSTRLASSSFRVASWARSAICASACARMCRCAGSSLARLPRGSPGTRPSTLSSKCLSTSRCFGMSFKNSFAAMTASGIWCATAATSRVILHASLSINSYRAASTSDAERSVQKRACVVTSSTYFDDSDTSTSSSGSTTISGGDGFLGPCGSWTISS
mmetsp:Transcript_28622/g.78682  ORF Transcript_28622/g.78682 Transcript_28622/m.78682 type:complete len:262 (+) Transcript_28622:341-1126(+)